MAASIELARALYFQIGNSSLRRISQIVSRGLPLHGKKMFLHLTAIE